MSIRSRSDRDACGAGFESLSQKIKSTAAVVFFCKKRNNLHRADNTPTLSDFSESGNNAVLLQE